MPKIIDADGRPWPRILSQDEVDAILGGDDDPAAELRRLQDENENLSNLVAHFQERYRQASDECQALNDTLADHWGRPPVGAGIGRRLKYLVTGR